MSHCYDIMAKAWSQFAAQLPKEVREGQVATYFGLLIEEMHEANHRLKDAINKDRAVSRTAVKLDNAIAEEWSNVHSVFVYGTLKAGYGNHQLLTEGGAEYLGKAEAPGCVYGPFPFAKPSDNPEDWIKGELYLVNSRTLRRLDRLEGHPHSYTRTEAKLRDGRKAHIYYYARSVSQSVLIPSGEWGLQERRGRDITDADKDSEFYEEQP